MSAFQAHVARLARAAETASTAEHNAPQPVAVTLNEAAQSLPPHIIAATDPTKLNKQAAIFRCPAWAGLPARPYHLHCERARVPFPALELHRFPYYLFGKSGICDYVLEHPSVSSVHAALIFNKEHSCFVLLDLGSTNGTRLQGKRVEARKPVPIAVGSVLQFGYSTRSYEVRAGRAATAKRCRDAEATEARNMQTVQGTDLASPAPPAPPQPPAPLISSSFPAVSSALPSTQPPAAVTAEAAPLFTTASGSSPARPTASSLPVQEHSSADVGAAPAAGETDTPAPAPVHLYQLVMKHKDVDNPISRGRNKGEVITRSKADALEMLRYIVAEHQARVPVDATLGFSPWTAEDFVKAVQEYCEASTKKKAGDLGMVEKGTFSDVIDQAAFQLRRGEVSPPVETQLGIHLLFRCD